MLLGVSGVGLNTFKPLLVSGPVRPNPQLGRIINPKLGQESDSFSPLASVAPIDDTMLWGRLAPRQPSCLRL